MEQKYGKLVWTDEDDIEKVYKAGGTEAFLENLGAADVEQIMNEITGVFMGNGTMRGRIFYTGSFRTYDRAVSPLRLSVYGVKGEHREKSISHYAHWYVNTEEELLGTGFFRFAFGNSFGTEEEYRTLKNPEEMFGKEPESVQAETDNRYKALSLQLIEKLWTALERNPSARFVIVLPQNRECGAEAEKKAEEESLDILKQVYLLLPPKLRLTLGFATCVTPREMLNLAEREDLPIHIFTTDKVTDLAVLEKAGFHYDVFQVDKKEEYVYDQEKMKLLEKVLEYDPGELLEQLLDKSEKAYFAKGNKTIDFRAYGSILDPIAVPWYGKDKKNKLYDLLKYREEQEGILACGDLEKERKKVFLSEILPQKNYGNQLAFCVLQYIAASGDNQDKNRDEYKDKMDRIREKLGLGFLIDIVENVSGFWQKRYKGKFKQAEDEAKKRAEEARKLSDLVNEKTLQISKSEKKISEMEKWNDKLDKDKAEMQNQNKELNAKIEAQKNEFAGLEGKYQDLISESANQQAELKNTIENLEKENRQLKESKETLEEENRKINGLLEKREEEKELKRHYLYVMMKLEKNDADKGQKLLELSDVADKLNNEYNQLRKDLEENNALIKKQVEELGQEIRLVKEKRKLIQLRKEKSHPKDAKKEKEEK